MKRLHGLAVLGLVIGLAQAHAQVAPTKSVISVSGSAEIRCAPDEVNLRLGVESRDPKLDAAVTQNDARIATILKFLKESGIDPKDVQTDHIQIHPQYADRRQQQLVPEYYQVRRNLGVRLRKVSEFDTILAGVLRSGVNYVDGVEFRTTELRKHRDSARQQAIRAAKEKATALSSELDLKLGKATSINERTGGGTWGWGGGNYNAMSQNTIQVAEPPVGGDDGNLAVGMISVTAAVDVTFLLDP
jgi:uncharacterized protein YggE